MLRKQVVVYANIYAILKRKGELEMWRRPGRKRLAMDLPEWMHEEIKIRAKIRNISITEWILRACYARKKSEGIDISKFSPKE